MRRTIAIFAIAAAAAGCRWDALTAPPLELGRSPAPSTRATSTVPATSRPALVASGTTRSAPLADRVTPILTGAHATGATVSACFVDAASGEAIYTFDANRPMLPASNLKLLTTAAALDLLGADATLDTDLMIAGDDLWLVGHGDPALGDAAIAARHGLPRSAAFDAWIAELRTMNVTTIRGDLCYVDGAFESRQTHPTWRREDLTRWYAAPISGLNFNDNCIDVTVSPAATPGEPAVVRVEPATIDSVVVLNRAVTVAMGESHVAPDVSRAADSNVFTITGEVDAPGALKPRPITDPGAFAADALRAALAANGIAVRGRIVRRDAPPADGLRLAPARTRLADLLPRINQNSQNLFAEGLAKFAGAAFARSAGDASPAGSWANAERAVRAFLSRNDVAATDLRYVDGSGLSEANRVTARLLADVLAAMSRRSDFATFRESLALAGTTPSLGDRFAGEAKRVWCKTGYIGGVRTLAGYALDDAGRLVAFSVLFNQIPGEGIEATRAFESLQDGAVRAVMHREAN